MSRPERWQYPAWSNNAERVPRGPPSPTLLSITSQPSACSQYGVSQTSKASEEAERRTGAEGANVSLHGHEDEAQRGRRRGSERRGRSSSSHDRDPPPYRTGSPVDGQHGAGRGGDRTHQRSHPSHDSRVRGWATRIDPGLYSSYSSGSYVPSTILETEGERNPPSKDHGTQTSAPEEPARGTAPVDQPSAWNEEQQPPASAQSERDVREGATPGARTIAQPLSSFLRTDQPINARDPRLSPTRGLQESDEPRRNPSGGGQNEPASSDMGVTEPCPADQPRRSIDELVSEAAGLNPRALPFQPSSAGPNVSTPNPSAQTFVPGSTRHPPTSLDPRTPAFMPGSTDHPAAGLDPRAPPFQPSLAGSAGASLDSRAPPFVPGSTRHPSASLNLRVEPFQPSFSDHNQHVTAASPFGHGHGGSRPSYLSHRGRARHTNRRRGRTARAWSNSWGNSVWIVLPAEDSVGHVAYNRITGEAWYFNINDVLGLGAA